MKGNATVPNKKKIVYGILLLAVIAMNLFLTLQSPEDTTKLSETLRLWLEQLGYHNDPHTIRSNAHLVVFFAIGVVLTLFGINHGMKWWLILIAGFVIGGLDEGIKYFLPTREFGLVDLFKDCIGLIIALCIVMGFKKLCSKGNKNGT